MKPEKLEDPRNEKTAEHEKNEETKTKSSPQNVLCFRHECEIISQMMPNLMVNF